MYDDRRRTIYWSKRHCYIYEDPFGASVQSTIREYFQVIPVTKALDILDLGKYHHIGNIPQQVHDHINTDKSNIRSARHIIPITQPITAAECKERSMGIGGLCPPGYPTVSSATTFTAVDSEAHSMGLGGLCPPSDPGVPSATNLPDLGPATISATRGAQWLQTLVCRFPIAE